MTQGTYNPDDEGAETRFRLAVEAAPNGMLMVDRERRMILVNQRAEVMFGYPREELLGQPIDLLVPDRFRESHAGFVHDYFKTPRTRAMGAGRDLYGQRKDGTEFPIEIGLNPIRTPEGLCVLASIIDITARKQAEEQFRQKTEELDRAIAELERSNRDLDEFAYIASHDLRAPLRDVDNLAQWIAEDAADVLPEESRRHLATLQGRIRRMEALLEDLLEYSRAGRIFEEPEEVDVAALLENVIELVGRPESFTIELPEDIPTVRTPKAPLEQVFRNLIGNAIKHHHRGEGRIVVAATSRGEFVEFAVADDGPGIPEDLHARAFAMFQTLRPRDEVEGTGMGLALVKRVVEAHGGRVTLQSRPGEGATFRFTWPRFWKRG